MTPAVRVLVVLSAFVGGCADDVSESMLTQTDSTSTTEPNPTTTVTVTTTDATADSSSSSTDPATTDTPSTTESSSTDATTTTDPTTGTDPSSSSESGSTTDPTTGTDASSSSDGSTTTDATTTDATTTDATTTDATTTDASSSSDGVPECTDDAECDDLAPCTLDACVMGSCQSTPLDGVAAPAGLQADGDCNVVMCTMGAPIDEIDDTDVPVDDDACTQDVCIAGVGSNPPTDAGTSCPDGVCDGMGVCVECVAPADCTALPPDDECQQRTCNANVCGQSFTAAGTALASQTDGDCLEVVCDGVGGAGPVDDDTDPFDDGLECTADTCAAGDPVNEPLPAGSSCAAGVCDGLGGCVGCVEPDDCNGSDTFCQTITCDAFVCGVDDTPAGTDLPAADQTVACQLLECDGDGGVQSTPLPENTDCNDALFCNGGDLCDAAGACTHAGNPCAAGEACIEADDSCVLPPWINELHYDNAGADAGELVEVAVPGGLDPADVGITFYNGAGGVTYNSAGSVNGRVALDAFTVGSTVNGVTFYSILAPGLQNGAPDGLALDVAGTLIEFLSYEGTFAATAGVANGTMSTDIGVLEDGTGAAGGSLGRIGNGNAAAAFTWAAIADDTPGDVNGGQTITP